MCELREQQSPLLPEGEVQPLLLVHDEVKGVSQLKGKEFVLTYLLNKEPSTCKLSETTRGKDALRSKSNDCLST